MLSRALNGNAGLAGWNLVMLAPDGGPDGAGGD
jgi:hypothetical protein